MALIKSLSLVKKFESPTDYKYDLTIINNGLLGTNTLLKKQEIIDIDATHIVYSSLSGGPFDHTFNWSNPLTLDFDDCKKNTACNIILAGDTHPKKAHIAIRDTDFPPPSGIDKNVTDISNSFSLTQFEINRISPNDRSNVTLTISIKSIEGEKFANVNPDFRFETVTSDESIVSTVAILYPQSDPSGQTEITFTLPNLNLLTIPNEGVAILVVDGDPTQIPQLPPNIKKKGLFWIE